MENLIKGRYLNITASFLIHDRLIISESIQNSFGPIATSSSFQIYSPSRKVVPLFLPQNSV